MSFICYLLKRTLTSGQTESAPTVDEYSWFIISLSSSFLFCLFVFNHKYFIPLPPFFFQGNVTFTCSEPVSVAVTFSDSSSFLQLPGPISGSSGPVSITLQFRTWNKAGLLLTFAHPQQEDSLFLYLSEARLRLQISKAGRTLLELSAGRSVYNHVAF